MRGFRREKKLSTWRRLALHAWSAPDSPTIYGTLEIDATEATSYVRTLRREGGPRVTITHLVGHAVAAAIRTRPEVNAIIRFGSVYRRETIDVYYQVAFEGGEDLNGFKIPRADEKDVLTIARELEEGARAVRARKTEAVASARRFGKMPAFLTGVAMRAGTFAHYDLGLDMSRFGVPYDGFGSVMVTNVGGFGLATGLAPLVPFSRCPIILLVGEIRERPVVRGGAIVARPILPIGVSVDHRLVDGYQASKVAAKFVEIMEHPRTMLPERLAAE
ncbi:MAG: 2-oxo acid dehydrogenase subunit E2 [Deltaproteobacteria bacterium]|nr:2-oxo acid dehydrogenase subunit E2 [Deltaproteobacteria bacterium]